MQSVKDKTIFTAQRQRWTVPSCQMTFGYMAISLIFIGWMPFLAPTIDNADPLFALVITQYFYLHHIEVADQAPANSRI